MPKLPQPPGQHPGITPEIQPPKQGGQVSLHSDGTVIMLPDGTIGLRKTDDDEDCCCEVADIQACCLPDGTCEDKTVAECLAAGGTPMGTATGCATVDCVAQPFCPPGDVFPCDQLADVITITYDFTIDARSSDTTHQYAGQATVVLERVLGGCQWNYVSGSVSGQGSGVTNVYISTAFIKCEGSEVPPFWWAWVVTSYGLVGWKGTSCKCEARRFDIASGPQGVYVPDYWGWGEPPPGYQPCCHADFEPAWHQFFHCDLLTVA